MEAENAFSLSLVRHSKVVPETLWELKTGMLKKSGLLTLHRGGETFADLGGLDALKGFTRRALGKRRRQALARARGVLLLGVPGTGKSALAKALGNETGRPTLILDVGSLMGSLVGQTEERTRQALGIVDAMAPCVLFVDEIEKALAGVQSSGRTDGGVSARMFGTLLTWLSDHESDVFVVATSNDVSKLPPEFSRAERWDGTFFIDLPGRTEKDAIWEMYSRKFGADPDQPRPDDRDWTGAEIRSACRLSALLDVPLVEAAMNVVPVAVTAAESVERLRNWASGRCLSAARPGLYTRGSGGSPGRSINRDPSIN
jgi:SpoVK/Ycf46/Vps4 family AAA+-type ATPase